MHTLEHSLITLDSQIQDKHLLSHPFYQAWSQGTLSRECLKEYAIEYYAHVQAFPTYLSALHSHTEDLATRREILNNLIEEEAGSPNHPELWKQFALHLGTTEEELTTYEPCLEIQTLIATFRAICKEGSISEGLAALYAYESQIPAICVSKIKGLKTHYAFSNPSAWSYFTVHIHADEEHAKVERHLLAKHTTTETMPSVHAAAERVLTALWDFLSHLCHRYQIAC